MKKIICGIEVDVIRRNVKNIRIKIDRELNVCLIIPICCAEKEGINFFITKESWVKERLSTKCIKRPLVIKSGEVVYVFGKAQKVIVMPNIVNNIVLDGDSIIFYTKNLEENYLKEQFEKFLKKILLFKSKEYFQKWEQRTGLNKTSLTIRKTVSRWGSCNCESGAINLSLYLACLPEFCLDYVVLHELCHLKYSNHGENFKGELDKYMLNWREIRSFMRENANRYLYK